MVMIIAHHFSVHGGFNLTTNAITLNKLWLQFIFMGGSLGNDIFVLISGYFLVNSSGLNFKRLFNLWLRMFLYSATIYMLFVFSGLEAVSFKGVVKALMSVTHGWWFAKVYFVMYLIHPYINKLIKSMTREEYTKFIKALAIYWCIIPTFTKSDFGANNTINFICLYCFAAYISLWCDNLKGAKYIKLGVLCIMINFLGVIILDFVFPRGAHYFLGMMRPFTLLATLCLLAGFREINISHGAFINRIASATFGVYLIHDNDCVRPFLWKTVFRVASFQSSEYLIPYTIAVVVIVYVSCTLIELTRSKVFRTLSHGRLS